MKRKFEVTWSKEVKDKINPPKKKCRKNDLLIDDLIAIEKNLPIYISINHISMIKTLFSKFSKQRKLDRLLSHVGYKPFFDILESKNLGFFKEMLLILPEKSKLLMACYKNYSLLEKLILVILQNITNNHLDRENIINISSYFNALEEKIISIAEDYGDLYPNAKTIFLQLLRESKLKPQIDTKISETPKSTLDVEMEKKFVNAFKQVNSNLNSNLSITINNLNADNINKFEQYISDNFSLNKNFIQRINDNTLFVELNTENVKVISQLINTGKCGFNYAHDL